MFPSSITWFILGVCVLAPCQGNVLFHFSLDFNVKEPEDSMESINKTIIVEDNEITIVDNELASSTTSSPPASSPITWSEEPQYSETALRHLVETKRLVQQLNVELSPLVGRSDYLARRLKRTLRYVNEVEASLENDHFAQQVEQLRNYLTLVHDLRAPSSIPESVRSIEFVLLSLLMEKYHLLAKRDEVAQYLKQADEAWARYKNAQVVVSES